MPGGAGEVLSQSEVCLPSHCSRRSPLAWRGVKPMDGGLPGCLLGLFLSFPEAVIQQQRCYASKGEPKHWRRGSSSVCFFFSFFLGLGLSTGNQRTWALFLPATKFLLLFPCSVQCFVLMERLVSKCWCAGTSEHVAPSDMQG